jgi:hypothetical protein
MSNVINFNGYTKLDITPDKVLECAKGQCETVLVIGKEHEGNLYVASSTANTGEILRLMELLKFKLMRGDYD